MKKTLLTFIMTVAAICATNAQVYLGGSIGFSTANIDLDEADYGDTSGLSLETTSFSFVPELGYTLNSKWDIGIQFQVDSAVTIGFAYTF